MVVDHYLLVFYVEYVLSFRVESLDKSFITISTSGSRQKILFSFQLS